MSEINQLKLEKLHAHYQKTKSFDDAANILKVSSEPIIKQYIDAVKAKYPDLYEDSEAPAEDEDDGLGEAPEEKPAEKDEPAPTEPVTAPKVTPAKAKEPVAQPVEPKTFWLKGGDGTAVELDLVRETPTKFILSEKPVEAPTGE